MNAEIIARLERSLSEEPAINGISMNQLFKKLEEMEQMIRAGQLEAPVRMVRLNSGRFASITALRSQAQKAIRAGLRDESVDAIEREIAEVLSSLTKGATQREQGELSSLLTILKDLPTPSALGGHANRLDVERKMKADAKTDAGNVQGLIADAEAAIKNGVLDANAQEVLQRIDGLFAYGDVEGPGRSELLGLRNIIRELRPEPAQQGLDVDAKPKTQPRKRKNVAGE